MDIKEVLSSLGYTLREDGPKYWRAGAIYRQSNNLSSLRIKKDSGYWIDFAENTHGPLEKLIQLTTGISDISEIKKYLNKNQVFALNQEKEEPKIKMPDSWNESILVDLVRNHSYWNLRGIRNDILNPLKGGVAIKGRLASRYVFPIFDHKTDKKILGFSGRDITEKSPIKYKIIGEKRNFVYPLFFNRSSINESKSVILVEGISDGLYLMRAGIYNFLCLFGTHVSDAIISSLTSLRIKKIVISLNRDGIENDFVGEKASKEVEQRLLQFFNPNKVTIKLPPESDFGESSTRQMEYWKEEFENLIKK